MPTTTAPLESVLKKLHDLHGQIELMEVEKQKKLKEDLQHKQLLKALDDPKTRKALQSRLVLARNQIDALALQLDTQREAVTAARAGLQKALDKIGKPALLSEALASKLEGITSKASTSLNIAGVAARASSPAAPARKTTRKTTKKATKKTTTTRKPTPR